MAFLLSAWRLGFSGLLWTWGWSLGSPWEDWWEHPLSRVENLRDPGFCLSPDWHPLPGQASLSWVDSSFGFSAVVHWAEDTLGGSRGGNLLAVAGDMARPWVFMAVDQYKQKTQLGATNWATSTRLVMLGLSWGEEARVNFGLGALWPLAGSFRIPCVLGFGSRSFSLFMETLMGASTAPALVGASVRGEGWSLGGRLSPEDTLRWVLRGRARDLGFLWGDVVVGTRANGGLDLVGGAGASLGFGSWRLRPGLVHLAAGPVSPYLEAELNWGDLVLGLNAQKEGGGAWLWLFW